MVSWFSLIWQPQSDPSRRAEQDVQVGALRGLGVACPLPDCRRGRPEVQIIPTTATDVGYIMWWHRMCGNESRAPGVGRRSTSSSACSPRPTPTAEAANREKPFPQRPRARGSRPLRRVYDVCPPHELRWSRVRAHFGARFPVACSVDACS